MSDEVKFGNMDMGGNSRGANQNTNDTVHSMIFSVHILVNQLLTRY